MRPEPPTFDEIELRRGALVARVRPDVGGSLSGLWLERGPEAVPVLRGAGPEAASPLAMASFPLVPFCNRIAGGRFRWDGGEIRLAPNHAGDRYPLHGYGWQARWRVVAAAPDAVELAWRHEPGDWPWPFEARQRYALADGTLRIELAVQNSGATPMPAGLGHHPHFPRSAATRFAADLAELVEVGPDLIPMRRVANPWRAAMRDGIAIDGLRLDNGFTGWDGRAWVEQPDLGLAVVLESARTCAFHLYVPDAPLLCAEAVTNEPDAPNRPDARAPLVPVAPGEWLRYALDLRVLEWRQPGDRPPEWVQTSTVPR